jgi:methyl-accepting chemotaxis protein
MTSIEIKEKISRDECKGEKIINIFRFTLSFIYVFGMPVISFVRNNEGYGHIPLRAHIFTAIFFLYSVFLFFYLRNKELIHGRFKYICSALDMLIISASIWVTCTYLEILPPVTFLSILAQFYVILILAGSFRYSIPCAVFSGIFAGFCYLIVIIANKNVIDLPYSFIFEGKTIDVNFPIYNESFRVMGMIVAGAITGIACKRHLDLFTNMIDSQSAASDTVLQSVEQSRNMTKIISKSTNEIFLSSKDIFSTANNQAASVQEIESTINENARIAGEISEKTSNVAAIASKMENDIIQGFSVLESNIGQLEEIKIKNDGVIAGILALGNKIAKIRDIIITINDITDQTKVIAFNAALEAASAGERGKRFAVVASEVNRLADDITTLTKQIKEQADEIQSSSSSLINSGEESSNKINLGNILIKKLEDIFREIRSGAEITANQAQTITEATLIQQKSTEQINIAIADISRGLSNFIQSTKIATSSAGELTKMMHELDVLLASNKAPQTGADVSG